MGFVHSSLPPFRREISSEARKISAREWIAQASRRMARRRRSCNFAKLLDFRRRRQAPRGQASRRERFFPSLSGRTVKKRSLVRASIPPFVLSGPQSPPFVLSGDGRSPATSKDRREMQAAPFGRLRGRLRRRARCGAPSACPELVEGLRANGWLENRIALGGNRGVPSEGVRPAFPGCKLCRRSAAPDRGSPRR